MSSLAIPSRLEVPFDLNLVRKAPGFEVPDIEGTVEGWRAWIVDRTLPPFGVDPKLRSVTHQDYVWYPQQTAEAVCSRHKGGEDGKPSGDAKCSCGFYSAKSLKHLMQLGYHTYADYDNNQYVKVVGRVANWGQVTEGTQGWRSQFSYPVMLFVPYEAHYLAKPLMKAFGSKVRLLNFLKAPGEVSQLKAVQGMIEVPAVAKVKRQGRRCKHKTLPFEGYLGSEPYDKDGEEWVEVRWDARMDSPVQMKMANLTVSKKEDHYEA